MLGVTTLQDSVTIIQIVHPLFIHDLSTYVEMLLKNVLPKTARTRPWKIESHRRFEIVGCVQFSIAFPVIRLSSNCAMRDIHSSQMTASNVFMCHCRYYRT